MAEAFDIDGLKDFFDIADDGIEKQLPKLQEQQDEKQKLKDAVAGMQQALQTSTELIGKFSSSLSGPKTIEDGLEVITKELAGLLAKSNALVDHCKYCIESQMLLDGEMVSAVSSLISSTQGIIGQFTTIFRDRVKFMHSCEMENLKLKNKLHFAENYLRLKAQYDPKMIEAGAAESDEEKLAYRQEDVIKQIIDAAKNASIDATPSA